MKLNLMWALAFTVWFGVPGLTGVSHLGLGHAQEVNEALQLPEPGRSGGKPLMEALNERRTIRELKPEPLNRQQLSDLLWAAFGINRQDDGRRTAPSAMNSQELDIYVALPDGLYVYDAKQHRLALKQKEDLRSRTGQAFSKDASVVLIYVAELTRLAKAKPDTRSYYAAFDAGCICQNVYLYCASEGLATVVHDLNRAPLAAAMKLGTEQQIIMAQAVGKKGT